VPGQQFAGELHCVGDRRKLRQSFVKEHSARFGSGFLERGALSLTTSQTEVGAWARCVLVLIGMVVTSGAAVAADIVSYALVQDDATLRVQGKTIRLYGVYVADTRPFCDTTFRPTRCKTRAAVALASRIQGFVRCDPQVRYRDGSIGAFCSVDGGSVTAAPIDLGGYLIREGWAVALPEAPFAYHTYQEIAKVNRRGVWGFQADSIIR
jgi:endonuclease YncB( thermonuclease family)